MAKTYQEYLRENGATNEDIVILASPVAIKAWDKAQADAEAAQAVAIKQAGESWDATTLNWWETEYKPGLDKSNQEIVRLTREVHGVNAALAKAKELGLTEIAIAAGTPPETPASAAVPAGFDPKKFVSAEDFQSAFDRTGEAIAQAQTLFAEHHALFGSFPTDIEDMRKAAVASRGQKNIRQVWEEKYKVADKRSEIAAAKQKAHDDAIRAETRSAVTQELAGANPGLRQPVASRHSLTPRPEDKDKKFFERDPNAAQRDRVAKFAAKVQ